ncbi:MAG: hypothetical protein LC725_04260, partial [Lentisphaerae bacterium]|nr:hypothetical protein [Lentisphaerota bacterium]
MVRAAAAVAIPFLVRLLLRDHLPSGNAQAVYLIMGVMLALGPDFAEPAAEDPILRQSSRPACAGGSNGQTAIDPCLLREWLGDAILEHRMPNLAVGEPTAADMLRNYERHRETFRRFSPYCQVDPQTAVPIFLAYSARGGRALTLPATDGMVAIHHAQMGIKLKALMDSLNLECHLCVAGQNQTSYSDCLEFFKDKLLQNRTAAAWWTPPVIQATTTPTKDQL